MASVGRSQTQVAEEGMRDKRSPNEKCPPNGAGLPGATARRGLGVAPCSAQVNSSQSNRSLYKMWWGLRVAPQYLGTVEIDFSTIGLR